MTRRQAAAATTIALLLAACQVPERLADVRPPSSATPRPKATAEPTATPGPAGTPKAGPTPTAAPPARMAPPAAGTRVLRGQVRLDASYVVGTGAGRLISDHGAAAIALAGAPIMPAGGTSPLAPLRLSADGKRLVAPGGLSLVGDGGGGLITDNGAGLLSNNGAGVLSHGGADPGGNNGGSVVSNNGGSVIANNSAGLVPLTKLVQPYRLAQAAASPAPAASAPTAGTVLPAAGMVVVAVSLATGLPAPVGQDEAGQPVYAVFTDAAGGYALQPPPEVRGNLRVLAFAPITADDRLGIGTVAEPARADARDVTEEADDAADYLRYCFRNSLDGFLDVDRLMTFEAVMATNDPRISPVEGPPTRVGMARLEALAGRIGYKRLSAASRDALLRRLVAVTLADLKLAEIRTPSGKPAFASFEAMLARLAADAASVMANPPAGQTAETVFDAVPIIKDAGYRVRRPSDVNDFLVRHLVAEDAADIDTVAIGRAIAAIRTPLGLPALTPDEDQDLVNVISALTLTIGRHMMLPEADGSTPVLDAIEAAATAHVAATP